MIRNRNNISVGQAIKTLNPKRKLFAVSAQMSAFSFQEDINTFVSKEKPPGETKPAATKDGEEGRALNRRVTFEIIDQFGVKVHVKIWYGLFCFQTVFQPSKKCELYNSLLQLCNTSRVRRGHLCFEKNS